MDEGCKKKKEGMIVNHQAKPQSRTGRTENIHRVFYREASFMKLTDKTWKRNSRLLLCKSVLSPAAQTVNYPQSV